MTSAVDMPEPAQRRFMAVVLPELLEELAVARVTSASSLRALPRAIVVTSAHDTVLEPTLRLDAVNTAARRLGVLPRQTIAHATALVENLAVQALPEACVRQALQQLAEAALAFGSPASFCVPDTVWVEVSGVTHLFGGERELAAALVAHVRSLGHAVRVAGASGPWLARAFARHFDFDETGICLVPASSSHHAAGRLPISALPLASDSVAWFARLGLLDIDDLRRLPRSALAARLEGRDATQILGLIDGRDDGVLDAHVPERLPFEEQSWECPLESVEPLLFVLKGLAARLGSRLEGRGQAARELLVTIRYDAAIANLRAREHETRQHETRQHETRQHETRQHETRQHEARQHEARQRKARCEEEPALRGAGGKQPWSENAEELRTGANGLRRGLRGPVMNAARSRSSQPVMNAARSREPIKALEPFADAERAAPSDGHGPQPELAKGIRMGLASPVAHGEDLERIVRSRLQKEVLLAPAVGLRLAVTAITDARQWQLSLDAAGDSNATLGADPRTLTVLVAELSAELGEAAVGVLEMQDSHVPEKSSRLVPVRRAARALTPARAGAARSGASTRQRGNEREQGGRLRGAGGLAAASDGRKARAAHERAQRHALRQPVMNAAPRSREPRVEPLADLDPPTRLMAPIELNAPLKENELVVLEWRAFVIRSIRFEQRLEAVEWWSSSISRDYFRVWLTAVGEALPRERGRHDAWDVASRPRHGGLEVLVYVDRDGGKAFVQAVYD